MEKPSAEPGAHGPVVGKTATWDNRASMRTRWWVALIGACFFLRLAFYATAFPLWEGFDEWSHFAVVRYMANGALLSPRSATLPLDVAASLQYVPLPPTLRNLPEGALSHQAFWALGAEDRAARLAAFRAIPLEFAALPSRISAYQTEQAPLYYWLMTPILRVFRGSSLETQVFALRWASIFLAVSLIPLVFLAGRAVFSDDRIALGCAAIVALMPELAVSMARVSNESLAVVLFSAVIWLTVRQRGWLALGVLLGLGLITKAYFLAALVGVALTFFAPRAFAVAALIAGWWYVRNLLNTGTLTGMGESIVLRGTSSFRMLRAADTLPWRSAVQTTLLSHLYFGGWSSLTAPGWMYGPFYLAIILAALGLTGFWRKQEIRSIGLIYGVFWLAQLYNVILIYVTKGTPTSMGWYLYAVIAAQVALTVAGLRRFFGGGAMVLGVALFGLLDLYSMHAIALPYYTGLAFPLPRGELFARLAVFKPSGVTEGVMAALWAAYLAATVTLMASGAWLGLRVRKG